jgi:hypothetical protein
MLLLGAAVELSPIQYGDATKNREIGKQEDDNFGTAWHRSSNSIRTAQQ